MNPAPSQPQTQQITPPPLYFGQDVRLFLAILVQRYGTKIWYKNKFSVFVGYWFKIKKLGIFELSKIAGLDL